MNPLDELKSLDRQVEQVTDLEALKPIFFRLDEISKQHSSDFEVQLVVGDVKQHLVNRGVKLKEMAAAGVPPQTIRRPQPPIMPPAPPPAPSSSDAPPTVKLPRSPVIPPAPPGPPPAPSNPPPVSGPRLPLSGPAPSGDLKPPNRLMSSGQFPSELPKALSGPPPLPGPAAAPPATPPIAKSPAGPPPFPGPAAKPPVSIPMSAPMPGATQTGRFRQDRNHCRQERNR